jgi:hypothetical protein
VPDAEKEKIQGEIIELQNTVVKALEEINWDIATESILDSPELLYVYNGKAYSYDEFVVTKSAFETRINQKCTIVNENITVLDNPTAIYTLNSKWLANYKDGHSVLDDPAVTQVLYKKIDNKWRAININESGIEQSVKNTETSNQLNQVELMKQFIGTWGGDSGKDTTFLWEGKPYGSAIEANMKLMTKGKIIAEGKALIAYDLKSDKFIETEILKGSDALISAWWFTSENISEAVPFQNIANPESASPIIRYEFKSPNILIVTTNEKNKP